MHIETRYDHEGKMHTETIYDDDGETVKSITKYNTSEVIVFKTEYRADASKIITKYENGIPQSLTHYNWDPESQKHIEELS